MAVRAPHVSYGRQGAGVWGVERVAPGAGDVVGYAQGVGVGDHPGVVAGVGAREV